MTFRRIVLAFLAASGLAGLVASAPLVAAGDDTIRISGTGGALGTMRQLAEKFRNVRPRTRVVVMPAIGSDGAIKAVLSGDLDVGLVARPLSGEERTRGAVEIPYARTPFVFCANARVPVDGLTLMSVTEIYAGERTRWQDGSRIRLVLRPGDDTDTGILKRMSPAMRAAVEIAMGREGMIMAPTDLDTLEAVERTPGALGAVALSAVLSENRAVRALEIDHVAPTAENVADGTYPYVKTFSMVTRKDPSPAVLRFVDFVRSPSGGAVLSKNGQSAVR